MIVILGVNDESKNIYKFMGLGFRDRNSKTVERSLEYKYFILLEITRLSRGEEEYFWLS